MGESRWSGGVLAIVTSSSMVSMVVASISIMPVVSVRKCATGSSRGGSSFGESEYCQSYSSEDERMESFVVDEVVGRRTTGTGSSGWAEMMGV
jgi:hypothetical protein